MKPLAIGVAALLLVVAGLSQLRLEADIFSLLPRDLPVIDALALHADAFGAADEALISVQAPQPQQAQQLAEQLARVLPERGLASSVVWQNPLREDAAARAELLALLWYSAAEEDLAALRGRIIEQPQQQLQGVLGRIATSLQPEQIGRLMQDPFGFSAIALNRPELKSIGEAQLFSADQGRFRLLFVAPPASLAAGGLADTADWIAALRGVAAELAADGEGQIRVTGRPALNAELGLGMISDMQLAAATTLLLVALLFFLMYRSWRPLLWLLALLLYIVAATVALGGVIFGTLNAISLGFAAILMGLSAGYGLLLYQEMRAAPQRSVRATQRAIGPSILWASATTAGAFLMVGRSSLPGMVQLGVLVALGIMLAGLVMLAAYLWPLRAETNRATPRELMGLPPRGGQLLGVGLLLLALAVVLWRPPVLDASTRSLGPRDGQAKAAMAQIDVAFGRDQQALWLLLQGDDLGQVGARMRDAEQVLRQAVADGAIDRYDLPLALWPRPQRQQANSERLAELIAAWPQATQISRAQGFEAPAVELGSAVVGHWQRYLQTGDSSASSPTLAWLLARFQVRHEGVWLGLGQIEAGELSPSVRAALAEVQALPGVTVAGWGLASRELLQTMASDTSKVLLPMVAALLLLLGLAYRRLKEVLLSFATLTFAGIALQAVMSLAGWSWNLMNIMALPLMLGVAVDYSIHVQLALQRHAGSAQAMRATVGQAILLAGATTVIGFASLGLASNAGLASLGKVCASGVAIACLASVFLLPLWWQAWMRRSE